MSKIMSACIVILMIALLGATGYISYELGHSDGYSSGYNYGVEVGTEKGAKIQLCEWVHWLLISEGRVYSIDGKEIIHPWDGWNEEHHRFCMDIYEEVTPEMWDYCGNYWNSWALEDSVDI